MHRSKNRLALPLVALLVGALLILAYLSIGKQQQFAVAQKCEIGGPNISPIESGRDRANVKKISAILFKVKDDLSIRKLSELCIKKVREAS